MFKISCQLTRSLFLKSLSTYQKYPLKLSTMSSSKVLVILAEGAEEMETVISVDVLRRAGIEVTVGGLAGTNPVKCSRGIVIVPDKALNDVSNDTFDAIVLPGGLGGSNALANSPLVGTLLKQQESSGRVVATICAAAIALKSHGIALMKKITSYPSKADELRDSYNYSEERVVVDGNIITSRGPGTAFEFALAIIEKLLGSDKAEETRKPLLLK